eukprot:scaffold4744_cov426-Prasinococcus_capsulatus_cf.AAC.5
MDEGHGQRHLHGVYGWVRPRVGLGRSRLAWWQHEPSVTTRGAFLARDPCARPALYASSDPCPSPGRLRAAGHALIWMITPPAARMAWGAYLCGA